LNSAKTGVKTRCKKKKLDSWKASIALINTASIFAPILPGIGFDSEIEKSLIVMAIEAGAMVVSHANVSWFWITTQFSGIDVKNRVSLLYWAH
jgi:GntP family gluconate:H+ symporter